MRRLAATLVLPFVAACSSDGVPSAPMMAEHAMIANGQAKSVVCHVDEYGAFHAISIAAPALPAHMAHGDAMPGSALPDHSGIAGVDCSISRITLDYTTTVPTAIGGGGGGGPFVDDCPANYAAVGLSGDVADYFGWATLFSHRLECRELLGDGTLGASASTPPRGSDFGYPPRYPYTGICASDGLLVGIAGISSDKVASISGSCADVSTILAGGAATSGIGPYWGSGYHTNIPYALPCPAGYAATGTIGGAGQILDGVGLRCTAVVKQTL